MTGLVEHLMLMTVQEKAEDAWEEVRAELGFGPHNCPTKQMFIWAYIRGHRDRSREL